MCEVPGTHEVFHIGYLNRASSPPLKCNCYSPHFIGKEMDLERSNDIIFLKLVNEKSKSNRPPSESKPYAKVCIINCFQNVVLQIIRLFFFSFFGSSTQSECEALLKQTV